MDTLKIIVLGLVPMVTLLGVVAAALMFDRKQLTGLVKNWRQRFQDEKVVKESLQATQVQLKDAHKSSIKKLKAEQGQQFKMGFSAFLENCRTDIDSAIEQLAQSGAEGDDSYRSALQVYAASLDATLDTFQSKEKQQYEKLLAPVRECVIDAVVASQSGAIEVGVTDGFQKSFLKSEDHRKELHDIIQSVYPDGKVVVKDEKDRLVLTLEKHMRQSITQQKEMLIQMQRLENQILDSGLDALPSQKDDQSDWSSDMSKMIGS